MSEQAPVHTLKASLQARRLAAVEELAATGGDPTLEALEKLAILQSALRAVSDEIEEHAIKVGGGGETPLA